MDYAKANSGAVTTPPKQKAKATAQKRRRVPDGLTAQERHRRSAYRPPAICPAGAAAYGFLKIRFLPHYTGQALAGGNSIIEKEDFYRSFDLLCSHYRIKPIETKNFTYPYGSAVALHEVARLLNEQYTQHIEIVLEEDNGNFVLVATEHFNTQNTLFYIPVAPVHSMMQDKKRKKAARLLLCIFHYLHHTAGVPYYTEESSYLYWNYEMLADWLTDDPDGWDTKEYNSYFREIRAAQHIGDTIMRRLWNNVHSDCFEKWLNIFAPNDALDRECHSIARKFYRLWQEYPHSQIYSNADESCLPNPEDDYYDDSACITMEKYIGFVASTKGWLYNNLEQTINSEFGECCSIQEPILKRCFDGREQNTDTLDFECRLFPLINELCYLLNNMNYDT